MSDAQAGAAGGAESGAGVGDGAPSLGVVTHAVGHAPLPFRECLGRIAGAGGEHILLLTSPKGPAIRPGGPPPATQFPHILDSDPDEVNRLARAAGLRVSCLYAGGLTRVESDAALAGSRAALEPYRDQALALGCAGLVLSAQAAEAPGLPLDAKRDSLRRLARLLDALAAGGQGRLSVSVDVHYRSVVESLDDCRFLAGEVTEPGAGLLLNIGHLTTCRQEGWRLVEEVPQRIPVVGWKDHSLAQGRPADVYSVELGTGDSPFERYIHAFKAPGAADPERVHLVNVEHPPAGEEVPALRRSLAWLRRRWPEVP